jgi:hypothetical protein
VWPAALLPARPATTSGISAAASVGAAGGRVLWTPWASLAFGAARRRDGLIGERDAAELRRRWGARIDRDPYLNPHLSRDHLDCRVAV